jgi:hypothetical protein
MPVETPSMFAKVIEDHLELKKRNSQLSQAMPLERYATEDPFENHPLFKSEEQARLEETMDGVPSPVAPTLAWPGEEQQSETTTTENVVLDEKLWSRSRDFDWGD